jgi:hypothetical protein
MARTWAAVATGVMVIGAAGGASAGSAGLSGTFIQLSRAVATRSVEDWKADLNGMRRLGMDTVIVQWTAEGTLSYCRQTNAVFTEQYDAVERILEAVSGSGFSVYLGLHNDPVYWTQLNGRARVLRDYLLIRAAQNERQQKVLLERFAACPEWVGYYIPEEVDDLTWRHTGKRPFMKRYLSVMSSHLRTNDPVRAVAVSAFFRARTAPDIYAKTMLDLVSGTSIDHLLVQDGVGVGDPPERYVPIYFRTLREVWTAEKPDLWGVVETFRQTSATNEPFFAVPAPPERVKRQIEAAGTAFTKLVAFTYPDYMNPALGPEAKALHDGLELRKSPSQP